MQTLIILREEIICLFILVYLIFNDRALRIERRSAGFGRLCLFGIGHVLFDGITVYTVNHMDTVPDVVNHICHIFFICSAPCTVWSSCGTPPDSPGRI